MSSSTSQSDRVGQGTIQAGRYLWIVLPLIFGAALAQALMRQGLPVLYPFIQSEFGLSRAQVGLITSAQAIGFAGTVLLSGWLTDSLGVKRMIAISLFSLTACILVFPLAHTFSVILALAVIIGIVSSSLPPATARAVMDWFPSRIRALAMSSKQTGIPTGGALAAAVLPALAVVIGWRMATAVTGLVVLAIAIAFILLYRDAPRGIQAIRKFNLATLKPILQNRGLVITIIWGAAFIGLQFIVLSYFMLFVMEELGLSVIMAGGLLAIAQVSSIISRVLWGAASDFLFHGRRIAVLAIIGFTTVTWMLGANFLSVEVPKTVVYLLAIVIGVSTLSFPGVYHTLIGEQAEAGQVGVTVGLSSMISNLSMMVMPPLFGYLVDISSSYSLGWSVAAAMALVSTLALLTFSSQSKSR